ncbi:MAG: UDP-2,3-diacylglucosamine diphosphatase [Candidatus Cloacimonetes bacterium]|nr:UDP-2,3-diacylglucosamine diphosphatase [Candidatus Cloacimonadota bacterium]NLO11418.1 UDP-2,3-diacylglucosamine diphosphatase [Candidatus Cloacimonadota bacterium]
MRICVISDVHFKYKHKSEADRQNAALFLDFLSSSVGRYDLMVLNGDIFDLYNEWKYSIIRQYFPVYHLLANIREAGCRIVFISGNHDFWFNGFLDKDLGIEVYHDQFYLEADGMRMIFSHGDLYTSNDVRYQLFRRLIRQPFIKWIFNLLHPELALFIGAKMSRSSRVRRVPGFMQSRRSQGLQSWAEKMISRKKADIVVLGHSHRPGIHAMGGGHYANAGDWIKNHSYLEITDGSIKLIYHNKEKAQ